MAKMKKNSKPAEGAEQVSASSLPQEEAPKVDFDAWFALRGSKIPKHHHKEILKADFRARGLEQCESISTFDDALTQYGVKLG